MFPPHIVNHAVSEHVGTQGVTEAGGVVLGVLGVAEPGVGFVLYYLEEIFFLGFGADGLGYR